MTTMVPPASFQMRHLHFIHRGLLHRGLFVWFVLFLWSCDGQAWESLLNVTDCFFSKQRHEEVPEDKKAFPLLMEEFLNKFLHGCWCRTTHQLCGVLKA